MREKRLSDIVKLLISLAACLGAGFMGSLFTRAAIPGWYNLLQKPSFTPPDWLFAPVWSFLYVLMGISAFLVWRKGVKELHVREGLVIFLIQLILNILWSYAFFGLKSPLWGLIVIVPLWTAILLAMISFYRVSKTASLLLLPYILWVSYATALNLSIYLLNP
jgi:tryptophan-rich sensory protein